MSVWDGFYIKRKDLGKERVMRVVDTDKELFDNKILHLASDIMSLSRDNTHLDERYVNLIRTKALAILTKCDDYLLKDIQ